MIIVSGWPHLLLPAGIVLCCSLVEGPLVVCIVIHPFTEMVTKVKAPKENDNKEDIQENCIPISAS